MAIKTVNADNLAEFAASRPQPHQLASSIQPQKVEEKDGPKTGVVGEGTETISTAPDPGKQPSEEEKKAKRPKNAVQDRIDELVRERHELDEAFQSEYEQRVKLEAEISALKTDKPKEAPKEESSDLPDPAKYTDQTLFLKDYAAAIKKQTTSELRAQSQQEAAVARAKEAEAAMVQKIARAKADLADFDDVIDKADRRTRADLQPHIKAAIYESEVGAHIAYELAANEELERRISAMTPAKALLALGKLEDKYTAKKVEKTDAPPPETKKPPEPIAKLGEGAGVVQTDLSQPMQFLDYRKQRLDQIRARRRH